ncbi:hypothetical protein EPJ79_08195 [Brachyspira aalborgi]|uniref:Solute-binding protein family 5 domain-containing protein n=1 Tax=Brachyspira aalborgi TaxID=29522 RepID=A0A5C8D6M0_9SPIR|nr:ABC transporter substrate-binding protein [Brachyspira aalborgi]TXJ21099.1 hypothetical protein EPJ79_08195 [Brachyspira aalborgi]
MSKLYFIFILLILISCGSSQQSANNVDVQIIGMAINEKELNVMRDILSKNGFNPKINMLPDYASFIGQLEANNYDIAINSWNTVTGNPDYAVRSLFISGGDYNRSKISNEKLDNLIEKASTESSDAAKNTYNDIEKVIIDENAYIIPLYNRVKTQAFNKKILDESTVNIYKVASLNISEMSFIDKSKNETDPLYVSQTLSTLTSLDPIKGNDGSINMINNQMYIRIVNLTTNDQITTRYSLSYNYAIAQGNKDYYFILRDDVYFAKVENRQAVNTGERVGASDVVFSLKRAKDRNSVPNHRTYSLHSSMERISIVTDINELRNTKTENSDVYTELSQNLPAPITSLTSVSSQANNKNGVYQVVKITTIKPFPQVLNYLAHQSAGIVSEKQIKKVNTYKVENYDPKNDIAYGDESTITEGASYNNTLVVSGQYIAIYKNDYEILLERNPAFMKDTVYYPNIKTLNIKFIRDLDASVSALRSGDIYVLYDIIPDKLKVIESDSNLLLQKVPSNALIFAFINMSDGHITSDVNIRKAILYSIDQNAFIAVNDNYGYRAYTTISPLIDTGNILNQDRDKVKEYLKAYEENK